MRAHFLDDFWRIATLQDRKRFGLLQETFFEDISPVAILVSILRDLEKYHGYRVRRFF